MTVSGDRPIDDFTWLRGMLDRPGPLRVQPLRLRIELSPTQMMSSIRWGDDPVEVVYLHGGGQNAHTWDLVATLVGAPGLAIDLPGHGHSSWRADRDYRPASNASAIADVLSMSGVRPSVVVGMSLGGLTALALARLAPEYVSDLVLVDILPRPDGAPPPYERSGLGQVALIDGPRVFDSLEAMENAAARVTNPNRPLDALRRGVWHNATRQENGTWRWRYDDLGGDRLLGEDGLWDVLMTMPSPVTVVKGGASPLLTTAQLDRLRADRPDAEMVVAAHAGHAVQSDAPAFLAQIIRRRLGLDPASDAAQQCL